MGDYVRLSELLSRHVKEFGEVSVCKLDDAAGAYKEDSGLCVVDNLLVHSCCHRPVVQDDPSLLGRDDQSPPKALDVGPWGREPFGRDRGKTGNVAAEP